MLCSVLIWVVIFNHRAESASYIIAYAGICLWFLSSPKNKLTIFLMGFSFVLVTLSPTDLFPRIWREQYVQKYTLKAVPAIIVWLALLVQMFRPMDHSLPEGTAALTYVSFFDEINRDSKGFVTGDGVIIVGGFFNRSVMYGNVYKVCLVCAPYCC